MHPVSKAYRDSMKSSLRERAYIMLSFGLINQEAQSSAKVVNEDLAYFSSSTGIFARKTDDAVYATLEEDFTKVDGSMLFPPRKNSATVPLNTGLVTESLVGDTPYVLTINLNTTVTNIKGITIGFGENYPVDFDLVSSSGQVIECRNNTSAVYTTEEVLENTTTLELIVRRMLKPNSRFRLYYIRFGYGLVYDNNDVISSSLESYVSPIGADVPQVDFTVQLKNYDHYFNADNPDSAINFLETGQEMEIRYGYQLPNSDEIEWITGGHLLCAEWESDDHTATIRCHDVFRNMDSEFYKGTHSSTGKSYYDLAVEVLKDAGVVDYYVDPRLKALYTRNPLPRVQHKEALQIIANACRCVLTQTRQGAIRIKSSFVAEATATANNEAPYSRVNKIMDASTKDEYASLGTNFTVVDGKMFFLPRNLEGTLLNTGYVSGEISDENGCFETNPVITITPEVARMYNGIKLTFGQSIPAEFVVRTYASGALLNEYTVGADIIAQVTVVHAEFHDFDTMTVEFVKTAEPYNRIMLNNFSFGEIIDFTMTRNDMTSSPKAIKQEQVKEIVVPCYSYQPGAQEESLITEEVVVVAGEEITFFIGEPSYNYRVIVDGLEDAASVSAWGSYYVTVLFETAGTHQLEIFGTNYRVAERYAVKTINSRGKTVKWGNPLISDMAMAQDLAIWLGDYYSSGIEYEYDTRGNPELDVNDIVYQENEFIEGMKVNIYRQTLAFDRSFSGKVTARRIGG